jgi:acyl carrier protein
MEDSEIPLTIQRIIARQLKHEPERITAASHLRNDLGADSLDALEILFQLEEEFDIKIPEADARRMAKVQDIVGYVTRRIKSPNKDVE